MIVSSLMSDAKWRKLIWALGRPDLIVQQVRLKLVGDASVHAMGMPGRGSLYLSWAWLDGDALGPMQFRDIEWLEFPAIAEFTRPSRGAGRVPPRQIQQDLDRIEAVLGLVGKFPLERTTDTLRVIGHVVKGSLRRSRRRAINWKTRGRRKSRRVRL
jgi:hypothetical protein